MMRLKYITNVRIPTPRAQGYAIMKMCSEFAKAGVNVELIVPSRNNKVSEKDPFDFYNIEKNFEIKKIPSFDFLGSTYKFGRIFYWIDTLSFLIMSKYKIKLEPEDVIYTRDFMTVLFFPKNKFLVLELHDIPKSKPLFKLALKKPRLFFVLNKYIKDDLVKMGVKSESISIAPSGVDIEDLNLEVDTHVVREKLGLPIDKKIVMYIGLLDHWKGHDTLLEASKKFSPDTLLVIIGGDNEQYIEVLKKKYPNVVFLGPRPQAELAFNQKAADVLVIPNSGKFAISRYYTSPLKLLAHMVSKVPIVVSDLPSVREIANENNVFFAEADNPGSFAGVIKKVLDNNSMAASIADKAFEDVKPYSWNTRADSIITEIKKYV